MRGDRHVHGFYWTDALRVAKILEHWRNSWLRMKNEDEERRSWGEGGDCRKGSSEKLLPRISTLILVCVAKSFSFTFPLHDLSIFKQQSICHLQHITISHQLFDFVHQKTDTVGTVEMEMIYWNPHCFSKFGNLFRPAKPDKFKFHGELAEVPRWPQNGGESFLFFFKFYAPLRNFVYCFRYSWVSRVT